MMDNTMLLDDEKTANELQSAETKCKIEKEKRKEQAEKLNPNFARTLEN